MKVQELRIGNWVNVKSIDTISTVVGIEYDDGWYIDCKSIGIEHCWDSNIEPIPLTEEWLLKFGFIRGEKLGGHNGFIKNGYFVSNDWCFMVLGSSVVLSRIKYIHQLQNIYFALENEELKTKEND